MNMRSMIVCTLVACATVAFPQSAAEKTILEELAKGQDKAKALDTVLKGADGYSALVLYLGAKVAFHEKRLEDSAFLFYAGQLRVRFDRKCFPAKGQGGNSPFLVYSALSQGLGATINPAIMAKPKAFAKAMERLKKWHPKAPEEYEPGYEFTKRLTEKEAREAAKPNRTEFLSRMGDLAALLNDAEYYAAFRVVQTFNLGGVDKRPTEKEYDQAVEAMKRIEKAKKLKGVFSD